MPLEQLLQLLAVRGNRDLKAVVATASLELGIDIMPADRLDAGAIPDVEGSGSVTGLGDSSGIGVAPGGGARVGVFSTSKPGTMRSVCIPMARHRAGAGGGASAAPWGGAAVDPS